MSMSVFLEDLLGVLAAGLLLGAGLTSLFALGVRCASAAQEKNSGALKAAAGVCFGIALLMVILGILWITKAVIYHSFGIDVFGTEAYALPLARHFF